MLQEHPIWHRITARFPIIIATIVALVAAAVFGIMAGEGDFAMVFVVLFTGALMTVMHLLGTRYWMVIPFSYVGDLPAIPVQGKLLELPEVATVACAAMFLVRYALKLQTLTFFRKGHSAVQLYAAWALLVFILNPVGLTEFGAELGGLRSYAKLALALISFTIMANQKIGEFEAKWVLILILFGSFISSAKDIFLFFFPIGGPTVIFSEDAFYTWHQALATAPLAVLVLLFSRYPSREIFSRLWTFGIFLTCVTVIIASGKRAAAASIPLYALAAAIVRREFGFMFLWLAAAGVACAVVIVGHGELFRLPLAAQRALSILPARWDVEIASLAGGKDDFRDMLRQLAWERIQRDPWVGTGYKVDMQLVARVSALANIGTTEDQVMPAALGSAWHNTWLGYAADFGIPASVLAGIIFLTVLHRSWRTYKESPAKSLTGMLALFIFFSTIRDIAFSHTSGHSSFDAFARWWMYGLLVALWLTNKHRLAAPAPVEALAGGRAILQPVLTNRPAGQAAGVKRSARF